MLREICEIVEGPISAEVVATEASAILEEGEKLARIHPNIVVKCPLINVTLIFTPLHARGAQMRRDLSVTVRPAARRHRA